VRGSVRELFTIVILSERDSIVSHRGWTAGRHG
jgi:hypothetical protein